jgi:hypothetical protein
MFWSTDRFPKIVNGISGFTPKDQDAARKATHEFPDTVSVDFLRHAGIRQVVVVKDKVGSAYPHAAHPDPSAEELGLTWKDYGDTILYTLI